jgi:molybdenum cofactor cytidylyltransferase
MENINNSKKYSAIILSAGKSSRMGVPKFSLRFNETSTFLENIINEYFKFGCNEIVVVLNPDSASYLKQLDLKLPSNTKVVINEHPEWERFYSLKLGAKGLKIPTNTFVSNIDNPFVSQDVLNCLASKGEGFNYVNPTFNRKGGHPFLISEKVIVDLINEEQDQIHLKEFLFSYNRKSVEVRDEKILVNINTEEEYKQYFNLK